MGKKKVYLAGAMEVYGKNPHPKSLRQISTNLLFEFECISPVDYYNYGSNDFKRESEVMRFDLRKVRESDIILVDLNNIRQSLGTSDEILYSYILGKPIIGFVSKDMSKKELKKYVHSWKYEQVDRIETGHDSLERACEYINYYYDK